MLPGLHPDEIDRRYMRQALELAQRALESEDVPVGALAVCDGHVIGRGYNQREALRDPTAHAEMLAISAAAAHLQSWRLDRCTLYVTLEPCAMCAGAIVLARIPRVVFAAPDPKAGACGSLMCLTQDPRLNHRAQTVGGVLAEPAAELLRSFFRERRRRGET